MALYNVTTQNNTLLAIDHTAHATSEEVLQNAEDTDFESIRETRVHWRLQNISEAGSTADTLITNAPLSNGDRIFIRLANGQIYDTIASGVVQSTATIHPLMTSNTLPGGKVTSSNGAADAWKAFDGDKDTYSNFSTVNGTWIQYQFLDNTPTTVYKYFVKIDLYVYGFVIEGSLDGVNWSTISSEYNSNHAWLANGVIFTIDSPGAFSYYRFRVTSGSDYTSKRLYAFHLLTTEGTSCDTSAITNGAIPTHVFKFEDTIKFNGGAPAIEKDVFYEYGTTGLKLYVLALYHDVLLTGRTLTTRIDFSAASNEVTEITGQVYKLV